MIRGIEHPLALVGGIYFILCVLVIASTLLLGWSEDVMGYGVLALTALGGAVYGSMELPSQRARRAAFDDRSAPDRLTRHRPS